VLSVGGNRFALEHAAAEALHELERCPDERIAADERFDPPAPPRAEAPAEATTPDPEAVADAPSPEKPAAPEAVARTERGVTARRPDRPQGERERAVRTYGVTDVLVMLVALAVLAASIAGLWLLLRGK
jgi:hypothetical protein